MPKQSKKKAFLVDITAYGYVFANSPSEAKRKLGSIKVMELEQKLFTPAVQVVCERDEDVEPFMDGLNL